MRQFNNKVCWQQQLFSADGAFPELDAHNIRSRSKECQVENLYQTRSFS